MVAIVNIEIQLYSIPSSASCSSHTPLTHDFSQIIIGVWLFIYLFIGRRAEDVSRITIYSLLVATAESLLYEVHDKFCSFLGCIR